MNCNSRLAKRLRGLLQKLILAANGVRIALSTSVWLQKGALLRCGDRVVVGSKGNIQMGIHSSMKIGHRSVVMQGCEISIGPFAHITIGCNVYIGAYSNLRCSGEISIGNNVRIAQFVSIIDANYKSINNNSKTRVLVPEKIVICENVLIGAQSVLLPGIVIGEGAVIGAGSVVTRSVPEHTTWAGNPAREIMVK